MIYADWAASAPLHPSAAAVLRAYADGALWGNPGAVHATGTAAYAALERARTETAAAFGVSPAGIFFTGGGTDGDVLALRSLARLAAARGRKTILYSAAEHPAVRETCRDLEAEGFTADTIPLRPDGTADLAALAARVTADTGVVALMAVQNETGVVQDTQTAARIAHDGGAFFFCDAVQAAGHLPLAAYPAHCDAMSVSAHKFGGPLGVGALYWNPALPIPGVRRGGGQERGMRGGTENTPAICAMAAALTALPSPAAMAAQETATGALRDGMEARLAAYFGGVLRCAGAEARRVGSVSCLLFDGLDGENLALSCDAFGLQISPGSACHSRARALSTTLLAMDVPESCARGMARLSFAPQADADTVCAAEEILRRAADGLYRFRRKER